MKRGFREEGELYPTPKRLFDTIDELSAVVCINYHPSDLQAEAALVQAGNAVAPGRGLQTALRAVRESTAMAEQMGTNPLFASGAALEGLRTQAAHRRDGK